MVFNATSTSTRRKLTNFITVFYRVHLASVEFELATYAVIGNDCAGKSNNHTITIMTAPNNAFSYFRIEHENNMLHQICYC